MANTEENFELLNEVSSEFWLGNETTSSVEVEFEDSAECDRVKSELANRSSQFDPQ
jgi:hypothetical protein